MLKLKFIGSFRVVYAYIMLINIYVYIVSDREKHSIAGERLVECNK